MLYMVISTHTPDACPVVNKTSMEKMTYLNQHVDEVAKKLGITVKGMWADMPAHTSFALFDAPKAETLGQLAMELRVIDWSTSIVHAVITQQEGMALLQQQKK